MLLWFMALTGFSSGQDTIDLRENKFQIQVYMSAGYKGFFGKRYIEPTPPAPDDVFQTHQFDRFTKMPAFGFGAGILFSFKLSDHWGIASGISYHFRKDLYQNSQDSVVKYGQPSTVRNIHNVVTYDYSYNNLELPVIAQYQSGKFTFYAGISISLLSYRKANYTYVMNLYPQDPPWDLSTKIITGFDFPFRLYPTFRISYDLKIKNFLFKPFIGIEIFEINMKDFYFHIATNPNFHIYSNGIKVENCFFLQAGVIVPIME
jgi:hypothetical protein